MLYLDLSSSTLEHLLGSRRHQNYSDDGLFHLLSEYCYFRSNLDWCLLQRYLCLDFGLYWVDSSVFRWPFFGNRAILVNFCFIRWCAALCRGLALFEQELGPNSKAAYNDVVFVLFLTRGCMRRKLSAPHQRGSSWKFLVRVYLFSIGRARELNESLATTGWWGTLRFWWHFQLLRKNVDSFRGPVFESLHFWVLLRHSPGRE